MTAVILTCVLALLASTSALTRERRQSFFDYFNFPDAEDEDTSNSTSDWPSSPPGTSNNGLPWDSGNDGNSTGMNFDFGGNSDWDDSVPAGTPTGTGTVDACNFMCDWFNTCDADEECVVLDGCATSCVKVGESQEGQDPGPHNPTATNSTTALPSQGGKEDASMCEIPGISCLHGTCQNMICDCEEGWTGNFCEEKCSLKCENGGICHFIQGKEFCNCPHQYEGDACESLIPDPEEKSRALAGGLSAGLAIALLLLVVTPIILWRKRNTFVLKIVYYLKEYEDQDGMTYDAYVSLTPTSKAEMFVYRSLQPKLEKLGFKLFLQARDSPAGGVMAETIMENLEKSRRTILIITQDYVSNEWNRFERLIAHEQTLKLRQRIIPIILENPDKEIINKDKSLKHILASIKCLKFPQEKPSTSPDKEENKEKETRQLEQKQEKFWKRLELTMPKKKKPETSDSKSQNDNEKAPSGGDSKTIRTTENQTQDGNIFILPSDEKKLNGKHDLSANFIDLGTKGNFKNNQDMGDSSQVYLEMEI